MKLGQLFVWHNGGAGEIPGLDWPCYALRSFLVLELVGVDPGEDVSIFFLYFPPYTFFLFFFSGTSIVLLRRSLTVCNAIYDAFFYPSLQKKNPVKTTKMTTGSMTAVTH